ncbi:MAG: RRXRR domain-containing protein [Sutterella wadsworthensis]
MPCHAARARKLLKKGKAAVFRRFPFTIILKERTREASAVQDVLVKIDPGSKSTGIAVVRKDKKDVHHALAFICLNHRGSKIRDALTSRRQLRRGRRSRNLRYRAPRFLNRTKPQGSLAPSLRHRSIFHVLDQSLEEGFPITGFVER